MYQEHNSTLKPIDHSDSDIVSQHHIKQRLRSLLFDYLKLAYLLHPDVELGNDLFMLDPSQESEPIPEAIQRYLESLQAKKLVTEIKPLKDHTNPAGEYDKV